MDAVTRTQSTVSTASTSSTSSARSVRSIASNFSSTLKNALKKTPVENPDYDPERAEMLDDDNLGWGPARRRKTAIDC